jgi:putative flippase GtrA
MIGQFARYCLVGALNTGVGLGIIFMAMAVFHLPPVISNAVGFGAGFLVSFALNHKWTFQSNRSLQWSFPLFALICAIGYALNVAALITAVNIFEITPYLAQLIGVGAYAIFVFLGSRFLAFRQ